MPTTLVNNKREGESRRRIVTDSIKKKNTRDISLPHATIRKIGFLTPKNNQDKDYTIPRKTVLVENTRRQEKATLKNISQKATTDVLRGYHVPQVRLTLRLVVIRTNKIMGCSYAQAPRMQRGFLFNCTSFKCWLCDGMRASYRVLRRRVVFCAVLCTSHHRGKQFTCNPQKR